MTTYTTLPGVATIEATAANLKTLRNINTIVVDSRQEALEQVIALVPAGAGIFPCQSMTLQEIGYVDYLLAHPERYRNLRADIQLESSAERRVAMRRAASAAGYTIGSVNALTEAGELVLASHTGSQLANYAYTSAHVVWVIGAQKIVPTLDEAVRRVRGYAHEREDERIGRLDPANRTRIGKLMIVENESMPGRTMVVLVKEALGF